MADNLGERIRKARVKAGITQVELAKRLGITYPTANKYEMGHRTPDASLLSHMAKLLACDPGWLLTGETALHVMASVPKAISVVQIPLISKVPDDFPERVSEEIAGYISLPNIPQGAYSIIVRGDNMSPSIRDGDYVIFVPDEDIKNGDIIVVNDEWGESILRRYRKKKSKSLLVSDNPEYQAGALNKNHKIIGRVIAVWRNIKI
jgi:repressor LexA